MDIQLELLEEPEHDIPENLTGAQQLDSIRENARDVLRWWNQNHVRFLAEHDMQEETCYRAHEIPLVEAHLSQRPMRKEGFFLEETLADLHTTLDLQHEAVENQQITWDITNLTLGRLSSNLQPTAKT